MNLLTTVEYAKIVNRHPSVIRARCASGKLKATKMGKTWLIPFKKAGVSAGSK